uniref:Ribonuclease H-like domain-containing protein n=1 Tax=Tanacetum cinerariifolium TaxID=118510 RepID=A0A6L2KW24_TANCI|nr:ribonuclease H-like domain-containing protein [Tanacetum cinerariifolium]
MVSSMKLPILKKGEYILSTMKMKQYLAHIDYALWEVILNGNSVVQLTKDEVGNEIKVPLVTAQQILARTKERKAKGTLLMAIPDEHLARFHGIKDAKTLWAAIKTRFGGNADSSQLDKKDLEQIDEDDLEEMDLKWLSVLIIIKEGTLPGIADLPRTQGTEVEMQGMHDTEEHIRVKEEEATDFAFMAFTSNPSSSSSSNFEEGVTETMFDNRSSDEENSVGNDRFKNGEGYHVVPLPFIGNYMPPKSDLSFARLDDSIYKFKISETVTSLTKDEKDVTETSTACVEKPKKDSLSHLIKDYTFHEDRMDKKFMLPTNVGKGTGHKESRPVWNNIQRINYKNNFAPTTLFTRSGRIPVSATKLKDATSTSAAKLVNTTGPKQSVNFSRTRSTFHKSHLPIGRSFYNVTAHSRRNSTERVNTIWSKDVSTAKGNRVTTVKTTCCVWRPRVNAIDQLSKDNRWICTRVDYVDPQGRLKHITGNKAYLADYQEIHDGGFVAFASSRGKIIEKEAIDAADALRKEFEQGCMDQSGVTQACSTNSFNTVSNSVNAASTLGTFSACGPSSPHPDAFILAKTLLHVDRDDPQIPNLEETAKLQSTSIFNSAYDDDLDIHTSTVQSVGAEADFNNMESSTIVSPIPTYRVHLYHPKDQILRDPKLTVQTRGMAKKMEPKKVSQALDDESWVEAMQEELLQFSLQKVWRLVDLPYGKKATGTKWVYWNKKDERGIVVRNKARLVTQVHKQKEGIDYDEVFPYVARIKAIRIFLAFASFMGFIIYQMNIKSSFLYGTIEDEVYVSQPPGFINPQFPNKIYKVEKALYGELTFFLGLRVKQSEEGIFISQDKNVVEILKKFDFSSVKTTSTPIATQKPLIRDEELISWQCKKQTVVANSTTKAEYVAVAHYYGQVLWIQN